MEVKTTTSYLFTSAKVFIILQKQKQTIEYTNDWVGAVTYPPRMWFYLKVVFADEIS